MRRSLQSKMTWALTGLAFAVVMFTSCMLNGIDHYHFMQYITQNRDLRNQRIVQVLAQAYERDGTWTKTTGSDVARLSSLEGVQIRLLDQQNRKVWESSEFEQAEGASTEQDPARSQDKVAITLNGQTVGYAELSYFDPESYSQLDWHFQQAMTQGAISTIVPVLLLSLAVSWYMSRRISRPLVEMNQLASQMRKGNWGLRIQEPAGGIELLQLADSLNHLSEELQKQDLLRRQLTSDVAHELRTPLTTIKSHLEALSDGIWKPTKERFAVCQEEVDRLIGLVASLEKLTEAESEGMKLDPGDWDLAELTRSVVQLVMPSYEQKGVELAFPATGPLPLHIDGDKWKQVMINLLDNALKYTPAAGQVQVDVERRGEQAIVRVADTGAGIAAEHLPHLFERFYRVDRSRNRATGGAGIGLALVKKYLEALGGTIAVESEVGRGTVFTMVLPMA